MSRLCATETLSKLYESAIQCTFTDHSWA